MKCPYCNRLIYGITGFQEIQKFGKHLRKCKKYQMTIVHGHDEARAIAEVGNRPTDMMTALKIRSDSGQ